MSAAPRPLIGRRQPATTAEPATAPEASRTVVQATGPARTHRSGGDAASRRAPTPEPPSEPPGQPPGRGSWPSSPGASWTAGQRRHRRRGRRAGDGAAAVAVRSVLQRARAVADRSPQARLDRAAGERAFGADNAAGRRAKSDRPLNARLAPARKRASRAASAGHRSGGARPADRCRAGLEISRRQCCGGRPPRDNAEAGLRDMQARLDKIDAAIAASRP